MFFFFYYFFFFFFNDTATTEIYTLSLHDALPIRRWRRRRPARDRTAEPGRLASPCPPDRKSTRLNSSSRGHLVCRLLLEKKKKKKKGISINKKKKTKKKTHVTGNTN